MDHPLRFKQLAALLLPLICALALILATSPINVTAQTTVSLRAQVIYAANEPGGVDNRLGGLAADLQRTFRYSMYQLLDAPQGSASLNQPWVISLPGDRRLEVALTSIQGGQYNLTVRVLPTTGQALLSTAIRLRSGGSPALVGGLKHEKGVLIIAITAG